MIVGYLSAFNEVLYTQIPLGRFSANQSFVRALIQFSRADRLDLYFPNTFVREKFRRVCDQASVSLDRVKLLTLEAAPGQLAAVDYTALHASDLSSFTPALAYLRNRHAPRTPLTAITHSLNYRQIYADYWRRLLPGSRGFDAIVATSRTAAEVVRRSLAALGDNLSTHFGEKLDYKGQVRRIPLGVDADWFRPGDRTAARDALGLPREAPIIVSLGRFSFRDKMDLAPLVRVLAGLGKRMSPPPVLVLAGGDQEGYATGLGRLAADLGVAGQLRLKPNLPPDKRADLYATADVFVSPADNVQETFGLTVIEAMACGRPVVAADWNGYRDLVVDGETGWLIPTVSAACHGALTELSTLLPDVAGQLVLAQSTAVVPEILEKRLHDLLTDPVRAEAMGRAGRKRVEERFAWPKVIAQYDDLWTELKDQAARDDSPPGPVSDPLALDYDLVFGDYPSHQLTDEDRVALTDWGRDLLAADQTPPVYPDLAGWIEPGLALQVMAAVEAEPTSVGRVIEALSAVDQDQVRFHLLWLIKHGGLRLEFS